MFSSKLFTLSVIVMFVFKVKAQTEKMQQGLLLKNNSTIRLGSIVVLNKRTSLRTISSTFGVFQIAAKSGDTLAFKNEAYQDTDLIVTDFADKVMYLNPAIQLAEVVIKENSLKRELKEAQAGYRRKSVFYTGTPHYYYLVLKPMTFIYENFKSEVKDARRFNRYARRELESYKIAERFNDGAIKNAIPIKNAELEDFKSTYTPTLSQITSWNDYELINYIKCAYEDFVMVNQSRQSSR